MGMFFNPAIYDSVKEKLLGILTSIKEEIADAVPFTMEPVVYNFGINKNGSVANLLLGENAVMPSQYYSLMIPLLTKQDLNSISEIR